MTQQAALPHRVREFLTLREAERESRALPEDVRAKTTYGLALAFQKREAAEALWPRGCAAEALLLAKASVDLAASVLESFDTGDESTKPAWMARARAIADGARKLAASTKLPELEADARPSDEETFRALIGAAVEIETVVGLGLAAPHDISATRRARVSTTVGLLLLTVVVLAWWFHTPLVLHATASAQFMGNYPAENVVDDNPKTAWLLPDKQTGWVDVTLGKPRWVGGLRIVSSNPPYNDRSVEKARIEAFAGDRIVKTADVTFREPPAGTEPDWTDVSLGAKCDRVRINVQSFYKNAASIAEVQIK